MKPPWVYLGHGIGVCFVAIRSCDVSPTFVREADRVFQGASVLTMLDVVNDIQIILELGLL